MVLQDEEQCKSFFTHAGIPLDSYLCGIHYINFITKLTEYYLCDLSINIIGDILAAIRLCTIPAHILLQWQHSCTPSIYVAPSV